MIASENILGNIGLPVSVMPQKLVSQCFPLVWRSSFNILHGALRRSRLVSRAVSVNVESFTETNEINELFDLFTYSKVKQFYIYIHTDPAEKAT